MTPDLFKSRLSRGWDVDDAATRPAGYHTWRADAEQRLGYDVRRAIHEMRAEGYCWDFIATQLSASRETVRKLSLP